MTSISTHGGLVHVVMIIRSLAVEGITSLVRNSSKLITLHLHVSVMDVDVEYFNVTLKKIFSDRKLFTAGLYELVASGARFLELVVYTENIHLRNLLN